MPKKGPFLYAITLVGVLMGGVVGYTAFESPCVGGFIGAVVGGLVFFCLGLMLATWLKK